MVWLCRLRRVSALLTRPVKATSTLSLIFLSIEIKMVHLCAKERAVLDALIAEHGTEKLQEYIDRTFKPTVIAYRGISAYNARTWINLDAFVDWLVKDAQAAADDNEYTPSSPPSSLPPSTPEPPSTGPHSRSESPNPVGAGDGGTPASNCSTSLPPYSPPRGQRDIPAWLFQESADLADASARHRATTAAPPAQEDEKLNLFVRLPAGRTFAIKNVSRGATINALKCLLERPVGIPTDQQRLIFAGKQLEDDRTLLDYNLKKDSTLHLAVNPRGGKPVIYVYAPHPIQATVRLSLVKDWWFSAVYPTVPITDKHDGQALEWKVQTHADGTLKELATGLDVAYLFWEAHANSLPDTSPPPSPIPASSASDVYPQREMFRPGLSSVYDADSVLLPMSDLTLYLEKALTALGLHVEARTSFITYWLPSFLKHSHIALRFVDQAAYARAAPLDVTPAPDVVTRVFMLFRGVKQAELDDWREAEARSAEPVDFWAQVVGTNREDTLDAGLYRVIEWGGMEVFH